MEQNRENIIEIEHVSKEYPGTTLKAVDDVSLSIEEGTFVTILGSSGSGKTTLLKMINRLIESSEGTIRFDGEDIKNLNLNDYRRKLGYVIQQSGLFPNKSVAENIATVPKLLGWKKDDITRRVDELLNMVQLSPDEYRDRYPRQLSGGQQQRVGLARALAANPSVILMDEPFGAIDALTREKLQNELLTLHDEINNTIIFVTHDIQEAFKLGSKVIIMDQGKVQQYDSPANIVLNPANDYVKKLIGTKDVFDRLRVLYVENHFEPATEIEIKEGLRITVKTSLSEALSSLMVNSKEYLIVEKEDGTVLGKVTYSHINEILDKR